MSAAPRGVRHGGGELGDRRHHVDVRQILQRAHLVLAERALAADQQHRAFGAERVGDAGDRVGGAGAGGHHGHARLAGDARVAVGGVRGDLLVADVHDRDALVDAAVVDVDDVAAAEREDDVDALRLERLGDEMAAGDALGVLAGLTQDRVHGGPGGDLNHAYPLLGTEGMQDTAYRMRHPYSRGSGGRLSSALASGYRIQYYAT
jgi:hypothetical protein